MLQEAKESSWTEKSKWFGHLWQTVSSVKWTHHRDRWLLQHHWGVYPTYGCLAQSKLNPDVWRGRRHDLRLFYCLATSVLLQVIVSLFNLPPTVMSQYKDCVPYRPYDYTKGEVCMEKVVLCPDRWTNIVTGTSCYRFEYNLHLIKIPSIVKASYAHLCPNTESRAVHCLIVKMKKGFVLLLLMSALVVTVYPRPQGLVTPLAAAEGEPDAVGPERMTGERANGASCCPVALCRLQLCHGIPCC